MASAFQGKERAHASMTTIYYRPACQLSAIVNYYD